MLLKHLSLTNFRNFQNLTLNPTNGFNVLWGENGQGKTNILEAIYFLGHLKSFRSSSPGNLIRSGTSQTRLKGGVEGKHTVHHLEVTFSSTQRRLAIDSKEISGAGNFLGKLQVILFAPEEVNLVKGGPAGRRALMDRGIFLTTNLFLPRAQEYYRFLRQRNQLLREEKKAAELEPWTEGLIRAGIRLRRDRHQYLDNLNPLLGETYREITAGRENAKIVYSAGTGTEAEMEEVLRGELDRSRDRERRLGQTLAGPHRDDFQFLVNENDLRFFGSQGQQRSFIIALKVAQAGNLEKLTGDPPVLLLDDFTSELDESRREFLLRYLIDRAGQIFISTTDIKDLGGLTLDPGQVFRLRQGAVC